MCGFQGRGASVRQGVFVREGRLRATLPKILISNFHPEIDFAHNSSINFTWQVDNKYDIQGSYSFWD